MFETIARITIGLMWFVSVISLLVCCCAENRKIPQIIKNIASFGLICFMFYGLVNMFLFMAFGVA